MAPKVSIIIPVYNTEKYLRQALDSVLAQTMTDFEAICVDDGSTDSSPEILAEYATKDPRVRVIRQENAGGGAARNAGIDVACGEYLLFLDSDDFFVEALLEKTVARADETSADVVLFGAMHFNTETGEYIKTPYEFRRRLTPGKNVFSWKDAPDLFQSTTTVPWTKLFRRDFIEKSGLRFQTHTITDDVFFVMSALSLAEKISYVDAELVYYRVGRTDNQQSQKDRHPTDFVSAYDAWYELLVSKGLYRDLEQSYIDKTIIGIKYNLKTIKTDEAKIVACKALQKAKFVVEGALMDHPLEYYRNRQAAASVKGTKYIAQWYDESRRELVNDMRVVTDVREAAEPKVSVIIPVYNTAPYLADCLSSIRDQTLRDIEVICVNDGSTDRSLDALCDFAKDDPRFAVYTQSNAGLSATRNRGLDLARGRYVYFMDSDDLLETDALARLYARAEELDLDILLFNTTGFLDSNDPAVQKKAESEKKYFTRTHPYDGVRSGVDLMNSMCANKEFCAPVWIQFTRRSLLANSRIRFPEKLLHEDELYTVQALVAAKRAGYMKETFFHRRYRADSIMTRPTSFINAYSRFRSFIGLEKLRMTMSNPVGILNRMDVVLSNARNDFMKLSEAERYAVEGLPPQMRQAFKACISDWVTEREKSQGAIKPAALSYARIDVKNAGAEANDVDVVEISDPEAKVDAPAWLCAHGGRGRVIKSTAGKLAIKLKCSGDGKLRITLRGADLRGQDGKGIPVWVSYTKLVVDGKVVFDGLSPVWHNKSFNYSLDVRDGQIVTVSVEWAPESVTIGEGMEQVIAVSRERIAELKAKLKNSINPRDVSYARLDIKNAGADSNDVDVLEISDLEAKVDAPAWLCASGGRGRVIKSTAGKLALKLKCSGDGKLRITLRGADLRGQDGKGIPVWVSYTKLVVDGKTVFKGVKPVWHDAPFNYPMDVKDGQIMSVSVEWNASSLDVGSGMGQVIAVSQKANKRADELATKLAKANEELPPLRRRVKALTVDVSDLNAQMEDLEATYSDRLKLVSDARDSLARRLKQADSVNASLQSQLDDVRSGLSFRIGRLITWLPRKLLGRQ